MIRLALALGLVSAGPALADPIAEGARFAEENCARCHAVGTSDESPLPEAPAFRTLSQRYPVEQLAEALAEGIVTAHPDMPEFQLEPAQIEAFLAYLESVQTR